MTTFLAQNQFISNSDGRRQSLADGTPELEAGLTCGSTLGLPDSSGTAAALPRTSVPDAQTGAAADTFDEEYRCPGGQIVDAAGCEFCGPISNADCPYWPDEIQSSDGGVEGHAATMPVTQAERSVSDDVAEASASSCRPPAGVEPGPSEAIPTTMEVPSEAPASAPTKNPDAGALAWDINGTENIGEIFAFTHKLMEDDRWFVPDYPDIYQAMLDLSAPRALETDPVWADEPPLFLQRREA